MVHPEKNMIAINNSCQFREKQLLEKLCIILQSAAGKIFKQLVQIMFNAASLCTADVIEISVNYFSMWATEKQKGHKEMKDSLKSFL